MRIFIDKLNLSIFKENLISFFNNLDISSKTLSFLLIYKEPCDIDYLNEYKMKINFEKIKKIKIIHQLEPFNFRINDNNYFYKTLFPFDNFGKNLLYLEINLKSREKIDLNIIENINSFKQLEILILSEFTINSLFTIKLYNLITLKLLYCDNITVYDNCCLNLETVSFCRISFPKSNIIYRLPEVKDCERYGCENLMIDYESLSKVKNLEINAYYFININTESSEKVTVYSGNYTGEVEKKMIEKFLSSKTLKEIDFTITSLDSNIFKN